MAAFKPVVEAKGAFIEEIRNRGNGARWQEAGSALQQIMSDYCGSVRSEVLLGAGLDIIKRLKSKARRLLMANNAHELVHCLQILNLIDLGELVITCADDRKETRDWHVRTDYTLTNPLLSDMVHVVKQISGQPSIYWAEIKR